MRRFFLILALFFSFAAPLAADYKSLEENAILWPQNSLEMFHWDLEFIRHANKSIEMSCCFLGGEIAQELLGTIEKRLEEVSDLQVYLLACPLILENRNRQSIKRLKEKYPSRFHCEFSPDLPVLFPDYSTIHCHVKFAIIDERYFSLGGTNLDSSMCTDGTFTPPRGYREGITREHLQAGSRDQDIVGRGPLAKDLRHLFHKLFAQWEDHMSHGHEFVKDPDYYSDKNHFYPVREEEKCFVSLLEEEKKLALVPQLKWTFSGPMFSFNPNSAEYVRLIRNAQKEIFVANLYFNPSESILEALEEASARGVAITLITNGLSDNSPSCVSLFSWASRINFLPLFVGQDFHYWDYSKAKVIPVNQVKIYEYGVADILYHKKMMVVDGHTIIVGSYNLGSKSDQYDYEITVTIDSEEVAKEAIEVLKRDISLSREISAKAALKWYFDPLTSYLGMLQKQYNNLI